MRQALPYFITSKSDRLIGRPKSTQATISVCCLFPTSGTLFFVLLLSIYKASALSVTFCFYVLSFSSPRPHLYRMCSGKNIIDQARICALLIRRSLVLRSPKSVRAHTTKGKSDPRLTTVNLPIDARHTHKDRAGTMRYICVDSEKLV